MKIVIAPDSFKESMTAYEAAASIEKGILSVNPETETVKVPMADGGEGTAQTLVDAANGKMIKTTVTGPLGKPVEGFYGLLGDDSKTAVIEIAAAAGLDLITFEQRNPMLTTTTGVGELIKHALDHGARHFVIGIGGSATNDGGIGMAQALGAEILDRHGNEVAFGGNGLQEVDSINIENLDPRLKESQIEVACDVDNFLIGKEGASHVFGRQKGANIEMIEQLDEAMEKYAHCIERDLGKTVKDIAGSGAAGGLGAGLLAFLDAELKPGIDLIIKINELESYLKNADLVITGEGQIDDQTLFGKTPIGVAKVAKKYDIPVIGIAGKVDLTTNALYEAGIDAVFSLMDKPMDIKEALTTSKQLAEKLSENLMRMLHVFNIK